MQILLNASGLQHLIIKDELIGVDWSKLLGRRAFVRPKFGGGILGYTMLAEFLTSLPN